MSLLRLLSAVWLSVALVGGSAWGQAPSQGAAPGALPSAVTSSTSPLSEAQRQLVSKFVSYWVDQLKSDDPRAISSAREELVEPLGAPGVTGVFRGDYGRIVVETIAPLVNGEAELPATNAIIVLSLLRTVDATDVLVKQTDPRTQTREDRRLTAATMLASSIKSVSMPATKAGSIARELLANLRGENNWLILHQQLESLSALSRAHATVFDTQVQAFSDVVDRIGSEPKPTGVIRALSWSLVGLRDQFLKMAVSAQAAEGRKIEPKLVAMLEAIEKKWEGAQTDPEMKSAFGEAVQRGELLLRQVGGTVSGRKLPEAAQLHNAWTSNDRSTYAATLKTWATSIKGS